MRAIYFLLFLLVSTVLWGQQPLSQTQATAFKEKVMAKNKTIKTMQAAFTQKKHLEFMSNDIQTKGKMLLIGLIGNIQPPISIRLSFKRIKSRSMMRGGFPK